MTAATTSQADRIRQLLGHLFPGEEDQLSSRVLELAGRYRSGSNDHGPVERWSERSAFLITYADMLSVRDSSRTPLDCLRGFLEKELKGVLDTVHILPFFPWTSDDGFSVVDYREVEPSYGTWSDVEALSGEFNLMFDLVLNHCSAKSEWFQNFIKGTDPGSRYFHAFGSPDEVDTRTVVRPRPWPLLTEVSTANGNRWVWTTFSEDQVDLNFGETEVLLEFLDILLSYVARGAGVIRLDAVAFLWKISGTTCQHLPQTHTVVKLMRALLEIVAPEAILLTETNVPHLENLSYFGEGDEAHMVYQFSLPPLILHALLKENAQFLTRWASDLESPPSGGTFLNFTASHDGIGMRPLQGLVPDEEIQWLADRARHNGGAVNTKTNEDGTQSPYELNVTYFSILQDPDDEDLSITRFLCSQAIAMAMQGIPALYFNSLCGARNWIEGREQTGQNRTVNRQKWDIEDFESSLGEEGTIEQRVFSGLRHLLKIRGAQAAFHPESGQEIHQLGESLFAVRRRAEGNNQVIECLFNVTATPQAVPQAFAGTDLITGEASPDELPAFGFAWIVPDSKL